VALNYSPSNDLQTVTVDRLECGPVPSPERTSPLGVRANGRGSIPLTPAERSRSLGVACASIATTAVADDGEKVMKALSDRNAETVEGYVDEAEHAFIGMMKFYVRRRLPTGRCTRRSTPRVASLLLQRVEGTDPEAEGEPDEVRDLVKPLVGVYMDGPAREWMTPASNGHVSATPTRRSASTRGHLKQTNLSESAFRVLDQGIGSKRRAALRGCRCRGLSR
jgi:hypothetical protein